jgi:hypothetical protein
MGDHEVLVSAVDEPSPGANQVVMVVGEHLQVFEDITALGRGQALSSGHDARDRNRVGGVGLALRRALLSLPAGQERGDLPDVLAGLKQKPCQPGSVAPRALDADHTILGLGPRPLQQRNVASLVVGEFPRIDHPPEHEHRGCKRPLVRVDTDRHIHAGLRSPADLRCDQREDSQAFGESAFY